MRDGANDFVIFFGDQNLPRCFAGNGLDWRRYSPHYVHIAFVNLLVERVTGMAGLTP
jgi:hypothetical protein